MYWVRCREHCGTARQLCTAVVGQGCPGVGWMVLCDWLAAWPPSSPQPASVTHTTVLLPQRQQSSATTGEELTPSRGNKLCTKRGGLRSAQILPAMDHYYSRLTTSHGRATAPPLPPQPAGTEDRPARWVPAPTATGQGKPGTGGHAECRDQVPIEVMSADLYIFDLTTCCSCCH